MTIPVFTLTGTLKTLTGETSAPMSGRQLTLTPNITPGDLLSLDAASQLIGSVLITLDDAGAFSVDLLANDDALGLENTLQWTVRLLPKDIGGVGPQFAFDAPTAGGSIDLQDVQPVTGQTAIGTTRGPRGATGATGPQGPAGAGLAGVYIAGDGSLHYLNPNNNIDTQITP
jgi:hypothetical protein